MPKMNVTKSIHIDKPVAEVYPYLNNFSDWTTWSPWLIMDPAATTTHADDQKSYSWEGKRVGSGEMKIVKEEVNSRVDYDLKFLKPWKSQADVSFSIKEKEGGSHLTWTMDSKLPFFMGFMKKQMEGFVGMDYERGLRMLKEHIETGKIESKLNFIGEQTYPGCKYIAIKTTSSPDKVGPDMERDYTRLYDLLQERGIERSGDHFSIYHKFDVVKDIVSYTAAVPVANELESLPSGISNGSMDSMKTYVLEHVGPYEHLGNAWSTMMTMARNKEFKQMKRVHPFETYANDPVETKPEDLITRIHFPVK